MTAWSHLPNARYIDRVNESVKAHAAAWATVQDIAYRVGPFIVARQIAYDMISARGTVLNAAWSEVLNSAYTCARGDDRSAAADAAHDAVLALVAWDECGYLLDEKSEHVRLLASLGLESASLLLPACVVFSKG